MGLNSPLPVRLQEETRKAAKILRSFVDSSNNGLDKVIPRSILEKAQGFAIFTVFKAGFLFSARAGSGVVIARLQDGSWSAPSAIGLGGFGFGGQAGAEVTDFLIVLNSRAAVASFMSAGSLTLGGNLSVAVGPLGRNAEGSGSVNTKGRLAAMYSYSKTKGLFGGLSVEGSVIVERQDANRLAYGGNPSAKQILSGSLDTPDWAHILVHEIEKCTGLPGGQKWRPYDEEGEGGGMSAPGYGNYGKEYGSGYGNDLDYEYSGGNGKDKSGGRSRSGSGASGGGYVFGEGIGAGGSTPPRDQRKRSGSVLSAFGGNAGNGNKLDGDRPPSRPGSANRRTSSFNPFSGSSSPKRTGGHGTEDYNAGLTWDSDGPMKIVPTTRARSGSSGLRRENGRGEAGPFSSLEDMSRERNRSDASRERDRGGEADLLGDWSSREGSLRGGRLGNGSNGKGETDLLGVWDSNPSNSGLSASFAKLSTSNVNTNGNGGTSSPRTGGGRSRSNSRPKPFEDIYEDEYHPHETESAFAKRDWSSISPPSGSGRSTSPSKFGLGRNGEKEKKARPVSAFISSSTAPNFGKGDSTFEEFTERRPFDDYFGKPQGSIPRSTSSGPSPYPFSDPSESSDQHIHSSYPRNGTTPKPALTLKAGLGGSSDGYARAIALFDFPAQQEGDLGFKKGDVVVILDKVGSNGDWWKGTLGGSGATGGGGRMGIFPKSYVEVIEIPKGDRLRGGVWRSELRSRMADLGFD